MNLLQFGQHFADVFREPQASLREFLHHRVPAEHMAGASRIGLQRLPRQTKTPAA